ncbi:hypothetical protein KSP35_04110 [Aquihabitans sp. G128]|uniref:LiaF domain-containing protein n=1 Tax=Aquihabitans sp. G128 TaxID=2849779 RepID=UPI001C22F793|nr:LiaF domain-containing protein [Aquihabitans sp. G128]QXC62009.1 hypothetical protein KSP35_04110 [Aquihabitans sp. G128]
MAPDAPHRDRPLRADPLSGSTDVLDREEDARVPSEEDRAEAARQAARRPSAELPPLSRTANVADWLRSKRPGSRPAAGPAAAKEPEARAGAPVPATRTSTTADAAGSQGPLDRLRARAAEAPVRELVGGIALCLVGVGLLLGWVVHISWTPLLDVGLLVIGAVLVVQARRSTPARPLIALGVLLALISVATWRADVTLDGGLGRRREAPALSRATPFEYQLGTGQLTIDLRSTIITGAPLAIDAEVGVGRIVVRVPKDAVVTTHAVASGQVLVFGKRHVGPGYEATTTAANLTNKQIQLDLRVGIGSVEVQRG